MKKFILLSIFLISTIILGGCSQKTTENNKDLPNEQGFRRPDFGQPERNADITGIVKSISGNEVTIIKIERQERPENTEKTKDTETDTTKTAPVLGTGTNGGRFPGAGGGMGRGMNMDTDQQAAMLERIKAMSTGDVTVTIPVGIKMLKPDTEITDKMDMVEANLSDITKDKMINVWLDESESENKNASFVLITK
ncbi:MAG: hypothetical protein US83_C0001G0094 [Candidatus Falkowbacteria bacterium GW2011_GWC2_38_22]|uniref:Lipoprotein n=1 Tax=Candidatus Falkowbacteria bacterium GW2011_GWE1_38_31 TaxID=1618638 RepID=A0A0G0K6A1_9BACT|nr:MAG: hypothetical protein US73_C0004G0034 [Candidatus Falkowbacteria bacterium GW2011_GWF2_38_1205]KKQ62160.1 MAG: hypothetical protein US83_C0001G0094 [Candidatus Falkowbacteria bacterium GW2011_GWC2_38_22]KKQ64310.1 MAG: hypothetical protein US84_C0001G0094 [Candidatus Falkowbacteria bacterium GW2011_GWF1_38_22]KKQ66287.1 MAG: hypothetical protein US87_C0002G0094 [Candidatus Falkowbacteria bacterium GW2011_GWE2_38_254]KKQ71015.1 MAG: hypothetical protein US91_C0002G0094 [Candidatus Falkowb